MRLIFVFLVMVLILVSASTTAPAVTYPTVEIVYNDTQKAGSPRTKCEHQAGQGNNECVDTIWITVKYSKAPGTAGFVGVYDEHWDLIGGMSLVGLPNNHTVELSGVYLRAPNCFCDRDCIKFTVMIFADGHAQADAWVGHATANPGGECTCIRTESDHD